VVVPVVLRRVDRFRVAPFGLSAVQLAAVSLSQAPFTMTGVLAAELLTGRRIVSPGCRVTHEGQLFRREYL